MTWMFWCAFGAFAGYALCRSGVLARLRPGGILLSMSLLVPAFIAQEWLAFHARGLAGVPSFGVFPLSLFFPAAFSLNAPVAFLGGMFFVLASRLSAGDGVGGGGAVSSVYTWEAAGSFAGAVSTTLALHAGMASFAVFQMASSFFLLFSMVPAGFASGRRVGLVSSIVAAAAVSAVWVWRPDEVSRHAVDAAKWGRLFPLGRFAGAFSTPTGGYLYGETGEGSEAIVSGSEVVDIFPASADAARVSAELLCQVPRASRVFVLSRGAVSPPLFLAGLPGVGEVVCASTDPEYYSARSPVVSLAGRFPGAGSAGKVRFVAGGAAGILAEAAGDGGAGGGFDLIYIDVPSADNLSSNKYRSEEFLRLAGRALSRRGVLAVSFVGGENYLGPESRLVGASLLSCLESVFAETALKPGERSVFFASRSKGVLSADAAVLERRLRGVGGLSEAFPPENIRSLYPRDRIAFQMASYRRLLSESPGLVGNTESRPKGYLYSALFSARKRGAPPVGVEWIAGMESRGAVFFLLLALALAGARIVWLSSGGFVSAGDGVGVLVPRFADAALYVFSAGFAGMALDMFLLYRFQTLFGSLYLYFGLVSSLFMLGLFFGSRGASRFGWGVGGSVWRVAVPPVLGALLCVAVFLFWRGMDAFADFAAMFLAAGFAAGAHFPVAALAGEGDGRSVSSVALFLEMSDHAGGALGGALSAFLLIPFFGAGTALAGAAVFLCGGVVFAASAFSARGVATSRRAILQRAVSVALALWVAVSCVRAFRGFSGDSAVSAVSLRVSDAGGVSEAARVSAESDVSGGKPADSADVGSSVGVSRSDAGMAVKGGASSPEDADDGGEEAEPPPAETREIDAGRYRRLIKSGVLSGRKAMYYRKEE